LIQIQLTLQAIGVWVHLQAAAYSAGVRYPRAILTTFPSTVESSWKAFAHTTFGASASIGGIDDTPARLRGLRTRTCHRFRRACAALRYDEYRVVNKKKIHRLWREGLGIRDLG
jgi:hypothetical protein